jgi:anti-sigma factor RsiW
VTGHDEQLALRLLGPAGPELTCEQCFEQIDRYAELELRGGASAADAAVPGMAAHLDGCPACAEEHATLRALLADSA